MGSAYNEGTREPVRGTLHTFLHSHNHSQPAPSSTHFTEQGTEAQCWDEDGTQVSQTLQPVSTVPTSPLCAFSHGGKGGPLTNPYDKA